MPTDSKASDVAPTVSAHPIVEGIASFLESGLLPVVLFCLAWNILISSGGNGLDLFNRSGLWSTGLQNMTSKDIVHVVTSVLLFVVQLATAVLLLINRKPAERSRTLAEILVPLLASFFFVTYNYIPLLPAWFRSSLVSADSTWRAPLALAGLLLGAVGAGISTWGVLTLGRSFGILVAVRTVVLGGPYRYVRHPIYLGYLMGFLGIVLAAPAPIYLVLFPVHFSIMVWRAKLEESRLSAFSVEYRKNMAHTGFILPRLWRAR